MKKSVLLREELVKRTGIAPGLMGEIEASGAVRPMGVTDGNVPFYREESVDQVNYIMKMTDLGYSMEEIRRVIKKVGFPKTLPIPEEKVSAVKHLTVGDLAAKAGVSPRTLKHWEEKGIIEADMRSGGGFRLFSDVYVYLCHLIRDLQLFGYSLEQIKEISDLFRDFLVMEKNIDVFPPTVTDKKLSNMTEEIATLKERMKLLKSGIGRWEELVNKKAKEIGVLKRKNEKRSDSDTNLRRQETGDRSQKKKEKGPEKKGEK